MPSCSSTLVARAPRHRAGWSPAPARRPTAPRARRRGRSGPARRRTPGRRPAGSRRTAGSRPGAGRARPRAPGSAEVSACTNCRRRPCLLSNTSAPGQHRPIPVTSSSERARSGPATAATEATARAGPRCADNQALAEGATTTGRPRSDGRFSTAAPRELRSATTTSRRSGSPSGRDQQLVQQGEGPVQGGRHRGQHRGRKVAVGQHVQVGPYPAQHLGDRPGRGDLDDLGAPVDQHHRVQPLVEVEVPDQDGVRGRRARPRSRPAGPAGGGTRSLGPPGLAPQDPLQLGDPAPVGSRLAGGGRVGAR